MAYTPNSVQNEVRFPGLVTKGAKSPAVKRVQEWTNLHGFHTPVDSEFGSGTESAVKAFQASKGIPSSGIVDNTTWDALVLPMVNAVSAGVPAGTSLDSATLEVGRAHLRQRPFEVGGNNRGPWVRMYCNGKEGTDWKWCACFVTFILKQASSVTGGALPIAGDPACDTLAAQAKDAGMFIRGTTIETGSTPWSVLGRCGIFLKRKSNKDWTHTGFAHSGSGDGFETIEGNTSQKGGSDDNQAYAGHRAFGSYDFIRIV